MILEENKYTQKEISHNINYYNIRKEDLENERKEINKELRKVKEFIEYWKQLDISQLKIFK